MKKVYILLYLFTVSMVTFAQKVPKLTYSNNFANESLRGKTFTIKGKLIAIQSSSTSDVLFFLNKTEGKTILTRVYQKENEKLFGGDGKKYVEDVLHYHFSPELLKKITFQTLENEKGVYEIKSDFNNIPYEQITESKLKTLRWGFGELDKDGYELFGAQNIQIGVFSSNTDFENFKKELLK